MHHFLLKINSGSCMAEKIKILSPFLILGMCALNLAFIDWTLYNTSTSATLATSVTNVIASVVVEFKQISFFDFIKIIVTLACTCYFFKLLTNLQLSISKFRKTKEYWVSVYVTGLLGAILGSFLISCFNKIVYIHSAKPPTADAVLATANTYIVYVSFIFIIITILLSGLGIYLSKWFATTKKEEIETLIKNLPDEIKKDRDSLTVFISALLEDELVSILIQETVDSRLKCENPSEEDSIEPEYDWTISKKV
ncbi:unknown protein [Desulfotalea psychrophila LSv54]|uniref:Uncharacterized protein n=2 Tax=Desulfotalea psychrophila TaxID=84980 RepID=Q6AMU2_DESPS|nr:unknown protein [Desulfotalea psychrophila LSv54]